MNTKMKRFFLITIAVIAALSIAMASCSNDEPEQSEKTDYPEQGQSSNPDDDGNEGEVDEDNKDSKNKKILVAYYSNSGNTQTIATYIHDAVGGDLVNIETVNSYPDDYDEHLAQARKEVAENYLPPLKTTVENIRDYDVVFVGYPIWVETAAPPIVSFLSAHELKGKTVVPFCTSGTSSAATSYRLIASYCPESVILEGIQIRRGTYDTAHERVLHWLEQLALNR